MRLSTTGARRERGTESFVAYDRALFVPVSPKKDITTISRTASMADFPISSSPLQPGMGSPPTSLYGTPGVGEVRFLWQIYLLSLFPK
jgi:hypothetical protein